MLPEPLAITLLVIDALEALGVPYLIGGSLAGAMHGIPRATLDADLVVGLRLEQAGPLARALENAFYVDVDMIRDAVRQPGSFNLIHLETMFKVDVFVRQTRPYDQAQFSRRRAALVVSEPERTAYFASAEDTILTKLEWYQLGGRVSERQWRDVMAILKAQGERLDQVYLRQWAEQLNVADLLARAKSEFEQKLP